MKKILKILLVTLTLSLVVTSTAFAKPGKGNPTGEVISIDEAGGTITILTTDNEELTITVPADFDFSTVSIGMTVKAKGTWTDDGFIAQWVKEKEADDIEDEATEEPGGESETEESEEGNAWGEGGIYCAGGKEKDHPMAAKIAEKYGVSVEWVMSYACDGFGFGGVMLALQTQEAGGDSAEDALNKRKEGKGWGQIWKENGLVGNDKADSPPPGQLKKPDKDVGPPEGKGPDKDKGPNPNSNGVGPNKDKESENTGEEDAEDG